MWVQAVVLVLLAGTGYVLSAVYARNFVPAAELLDDPEALQRHIHNGPPGAPTREQVARLHDALRNKFGVNARGLPRVTHLDYDGWPDRMHLVLALDHNPLTMTPAQAAELTPLVDVVRAVRDGGLQWRWMLVSATAPVEGPGHKVAESTVVRAIFSREELASYLGTVENGESYRSLDGDTGVGTFGGSQDHTAIMCSEARSDRIIFCGFRVRCRSRRNQSPRAASIKTSSGGVPGCVVLATSCSLPSIAPREDCHSITAARKSSRCFGVSRACHARKVSGETVKGIDSKSRSRGS